MPKTVFVEHFDPNQKATLTITMSCIEWDELGAALAGMKGRLFQTTADAILNGLRIVGYYKVTED